MYEKVLFSIKKNHGSKKKIEKKRKVLPMHTREMMIVTICALQGSEVVADPPSGKGATIA